MIQYGSKTEVSFSELPYHSEVSFIFTKVLNVVISRACFGWTRTFGSGFYSWHGKRPWKSLPRSGLDRVCSTRGWGTSHFRCRTYTLVFTFTTYTLGGSMYEPMTTNTEKQGVNRINPTVVVKWEHISPPNKRSTPFRPGVFVLSVGVSKSFDNLSDPDIEVRKWVNYA